MKRARFLRTVLVLAAWPALAGRGMAADDGGLMRAIKQDNASAMQRLLVGGLDPNTPDEQGNPPLYLALREESLEVAQVLLAAPGLRPDATNAADETPLMMAALRGQDDVARQLLAAGARVNKPGWTPLHYAATKGHLALMRLFLERDADINARSPNGTTPLMMAAFYGTPESVRLLLDAGADTRLRNQKDLSALDFARRGKRVDAERMLQAGAQAEPGRGWD